METYLQKQLLKTLEQKSGEFEGLNTKNISKNAERAENVKRFKRTQPVYTPLHIKYKRIF
ncbi:MAG: hypothetical protein PHH54_05860 [Candidatus Nanoarchaeia archaeon]|nr:hypothetical protein [Candidatus Nanoarchaeia archaeon]MDD5741481.1 hypothetical protein [Candidatus Nanoarchaeia archaeon]